MSYAQFVKDINLVSGWAMGILETRFSLKCVKVFCPGSTLWIFLFLGGFIIRSSLAWNCPVYGFDFNGNDLECISAPVNSWQECGKLCQLRYDCQYWTWATEWQTVSTNILVHTVPEKKLFLLQLAQANLTGLSFRIAAFLLNPAAHSFFLWLAMCLMM